MKRNLFCLSISVLLGSAVAQSGTDGLLLHLSFDTTDNLAADSSPLGNNGTVVGDMQAVEGILGGGIKFDDKSAYIELPASESLEEEHDTLTVMFWLKPDDEEGYSDILTKGDWNVLKLQDEETLNFFTGGWRRGELQAAVPDDWDGQWHHVAGVADTDELFLYVDGELVGSLVVEPGIPATEFPWNVGRNAQEPEDRGFDGSLDDVRLYGTALSEDDVKALYEEGATE